MQVKLSVGPNVVGINAAKKASFSRLTLILTGQTPPQTSFLGVSMTGHVIAFPSQDLSSR